MTTTTEQAPARQQYPKPRLKERYRQEIAPAMREEFSYANVMKIPTVTKIVVNMGVGEAARDAKLIEGALRDLTVITGRSPRWPGPGSRSPSSSCARACRSGRT